MIQDVVYNHLGPSGNYLPQFGPYLNEGGINTWGAVAQPGRRGLRRGPALHHRQRLDVPHRLPRRRAAAGRGARPARHPGDAHLLEELNIDVSARSAFLGRPLPLIAESDLNDPRLITAREGGGYGLTAQWSDDFHHALYVSLTGDTSGYYADFDSLEALGKVFTDGFFHTGTKSTFRHRTPRAPDRHLPDADLAAGGLLGQP